MTDHNNKYLALSKVDGNKSKGGVNDERGYCRGKET